MKIETEVTISVNDRQMLQEGPWIAFAMTLAPIVFS